MLTSRLHLTTAATCEATPRRNVVKGPDVARTVTLVAGYEGGGGVRVRHHVVIVLPGRQKIKPIMQKYEKRPEPLTLPFQVIR